MGSDTAASFQERARQLGVQERCRWEVSSPDALELYSAADVYVSPSREDSFGLPVAEAMACGLPAITSVCAGVADYIHDGSDGFVLREPHDAQTLSNLMEQLQSQPDLRRVVGEAASKAIQEWDWNRNAAAIWELLKNAKARSFPSE